jgi:membrane dipeptidase
MDAMGELRPEYEPALIRQMLSSGLDSITITLCDPKPEGVQALELAVDSLLEHDRYLARNPTFFVKATSVRDVETARRLGKMAVFYLYQNTVQFGQDLDRSTCSTAWDYGAASSPTTPGTTWAWAAGKRAGFRLSARR